MGITLPYTFVSGQPRLASEITANAEACRAWINGQINTADIANSTLRSENILKPEHYGSPSYRSLAVSEDVYGDSATDDSADEDNFCREAGIDDYVTVPGASRTINVVTTSIVEIFVRCYCMFNKSDSGAAVPPYQNNYVAGFIKLFNGGTPLNSTTRRIQASDFGASETADHIERRDRLNYAIAYSATFTPGYYDIHLKARALPHATTNGGIDLISDATLVTSLAGYTNYFVVKSRGMRIEIHRNS